MNISRTPNVDRSRSAAQSQAEARTEPDTQDSSAPSTSSPNRAAHERQKLHRLQRMLGDTSGSNSESQSVSEKNEERATSPARQSKAISHVKRSRPKKSGMAKVLSKFFPACRIKVSLREELQDRLIELKDHFEKLKSENWSPNEREFYCDKAFLPIAIKAENARKPELHLRYFDNFDSFVDALKNGTLQNGRAVFPLPEHDAHVSAADIRTIGNKISILVLESFAFNTKKHKFFTERYVHKNVPIMSRKLPENAKLTVLHIDAQKSSNDCPIFALSNAAKLAKESEFFDKIHEHNLSESGPLSRHKFDRVSLFNAHKLVPASFHKHTQSLTSLRKLPNQDRLAETTINKKGDTLFSRRDKHVVERHKRYLNDGTLRTLRFNASIEEKRLTYLDRAIAYLDKASEQDISVLLHNFNKAMKKSKELNKKLGSIERDVGPQR